MPLDILLLEDDPAKKGKLLALLKDKGLFGRLDVAICTSQALELIEDRPRYDLLIADVVVPGELGSEKDERNCIDFFNSIDDIIPAEKRPLYSLPISAATDLTDAAYDFFSCRPWGILPYSENDEDCLNALHRIAVWILNDKTQREQRNTCDVFIITALPHPEYSAIENLKLDWGPFEPLDRTHLIRYASLSVAGSTIKIGAAFCARMGAVAASTLTTKASLILNPKIVIMAGICAGIASKAGIGDVVAAEVSWDWQSGKYIDKNGEEAFESSPHHINIDDELRNKLFLLKRDEPFWKSFSDYAREHKLQLPKLVLGPMATGSSVLADVRVSERIRTIQHRNVTGLDMETYGVYAAVSSTLTGADFISLKSVCDNGDKKKDDQHQQYAATISANAVEQFIRHYFRE
ncbi:hypothetical protein [Pseudomonas sp. MUP55]|uniref:phosphorylase family protein n=1 Tax=Pseudomonas sp. MUP55 TaxID=3087234 RepID=UPI002A5B0604|nr:MULTISPECIES: hypothetical protein [unclassified Pseudomonas]WPN91800.1 hypothetical protein SC319_21585 [Pseudomonas sp. MUP56]WPN97327.1 hypothetical protein SC318_21590 [Pseudomonas sp. MUP55]